MSIIGFGNRIALLLAPALISACTNAPTAGPTNIPTTPGPPPSNTAYRSLDDRGATGNNSTLGGVLIAESSLRFSTNTVSGSLVHATGSTSLTDGVFSMVDVDGPAASDGLLTAGPIFFRPYSYTNNVVPSTNYFSGSYQYVTTFSGNYVVGANTYNVISGIYGVVTSSTDIPDAGSATYSGEAGGIYNFKNSSGVARTFLTSGTSAVTADFSANMVSASLNDFSVLNSSGSPVIQSVFDEIRLTNMRIQGNGFRGGSVTFYKNGGEVSYDTVIGSSLITKTSGNFFGYDNSIGAPDEVAGVLLHYGDQGIINLIFVAD